MLQQLFNLHGRTAMITGASRGIGRSIARALADAGADIAVTARKIEDVEAVRTDLEASGQRIVPLALDVRDVDACRRASEQAASALGGLDILVNNAGVEQVCPSLDVDEALWDRILDTNLKGAFFCAQAAARVMQRGGRGGCIINLCSLTSQVGIPTAVPYGSSKSGLLGMTRALAAEWAPLAIRVNAIAPGYFRTAMTEMFYADPDWRESMIAKIPQARFGEMSDLGGTAVFLACDASAYVTGQCLFVDGGYTAAI